MQKKSLQSGMSLAWTGSGISRLAVRSKADESLFLNSLSPHVQFN